MNPSETASLDQFGAFARELATSNGLEIVETTNLDETWIGGHSGTDLLDALLDVSLKASADCALTALIAMDVGGGVLAYGLAVLRREPGEPPA